MAIHLIQNCIECKFCHNTLRDTSHCGWFSCQNHPITLSFSYWIYNSKNYNKKTIEICGILMRTIKNNITYMVHTIFSVKKTILYFEKQNGNSQNKFDLPYSPDMSIEEFQHIVDKFHNMRVFL